MYAANAILVGAALIASVTFAGWLQPPLGYSAFFRSASIEVGAPSPSGIYSSFVSVAGHPIMQIFWFQLHVFLLRYCNPHGGSECCTSPKTRHIHWKRGAVFAGFSFSSIHPFDGLSWMCNGCVCKCWLSSVTAHSKVYGQYGSHSWHRFDGGIPSMDII